MQEFAKQLQLRAKAMGVSYSELARRVGLHERRFSHYITDGREPDLATLVRIAKVLGSTTDELLGLTPASDQPERDALKSRFLAAANALDTALLSIVVVQAEAVAAIQSKAATAKQRATRATRVPKIR